MARQGRQAKAAAQLANGMAAVGLIDPVREPPVLENEDPAETPVVASDEFVTGIRREARALADLGLQPEHVAACREDGASLVIVTKGGQKLRWPQDIERAKTLTQGQKDGLYPGGVNPNSKAWHEPPEKNPALAAVLAAQQKRGEAK